jgi:hypothetical protein
MRTSIKKIEGRSYVEIPKTIVDLYGLSDGMSVKCNVVERENYFVIQFALASETLRS